MAAFARGATTVGTWRHYRVILQFAFQMRCDVIQRRVRTLLEGFARCARPLARSISSGDRDPHTTLSMYGAGRLNVVSIYVPLRGNGMVDSFFLQTHGFSFLPVSNKEKDGRLVPSICVD